MASDRTEVAVVDGVVRELFADEGGISESDVARDDSLTTKSVYHHGGQLAGTCQLFTEFPEDCDFCVETNGMAG